MQAFWLLLPLENPLLSWTVISTILKRITWLSVRVDYISPKFLVELHSPHHHHQWLSIMSFHSACHIWPLWIEGKSRLKVNHAGRLSGINIKHITASDLYKTQEVDFKAKHVMMYTNRAACVWLSVFFHLRAAARRERRTGLSLGAPKFSLFGSLFLVWTWGVSMGYRTVVMYTEIGCFVVCVAGWILVCSTQPTEIWTWSEVGSIVLTTSNYFSNLWKDCISDSTGVSDCKGIPSMLALNCKYNIEYLEKVFIPFELLRGFSPLKWKISMHCIGQ